MPQGVQTVAPDVYVVEGQPAPRTGLGRVLRGVLGNPLPSRSERLERLGVLAAVALIGSDLIASSVYGPEEMVIRLNEAGPGGSAYTFPVALAIAILLVVLAGSYLQTIKAYPSGAGGYIVARDNFGPLVGVIGASALLIDYTLDVAVSIATGVQSLTSAVPQIADARVWLCLLGLGVITLANLRGVRAAGALVTVPVYVYVLGTLGVLGFGGLLALRGSLPAYTPPTGAETTTDVAAAVGAFVLLRAFASGAVALTGVEAISNGVPYMKPPEASNARRSLLLMAILFVAMFLGLGYLAGQLGVVADVSEVETVHSQIARTIVGRGPVFLVVEVAAVVMLFLAANTGFADFPRLLASLAEDQYLPPAFATRGSRLSFSNGILLVAGISAMLLVAFGGSLNGLAPLFTVGAFLTFTMSQMGMVRYHWRKRESGWHWRLAVNGVGALTTAIVLLVVVGTKFREGAWLVVVCLPVLIIGVNSLGRHLRKMNAQASIEPAQVRPYLEGLLRETRHHVVIPVADADRISLHALAYVSSLVRDSPSHTTIEAVHITDDRKKAEQLQKRWRDLDLPVRLIVIESPSRAAAEALMQYVRFQQQADGGVRTHVSVAIPETAPSHWWDVFVRNYLGSRLKVALLSRRDVSVWSIPLLLKD